MGKSTTAEMFRDEGVPTWSADEAVHRLYAAGGIGAAAVSEICPQAVGSDGVKRDILSEWVKEDPNNLGRLEALIHPLVAADRRAFIEGATCDLILVDIPLLFETNTQSQVDFVIVVSVSEEEQKRRVLARPGMTLELFELISQKQTPDKEKRALADFVIKTESLDAARASVQSILNKIRADETDARNRS